jgi:superfamily I DNA and RNA helicase
MPPPVRQKESFVFAYDELQKINETAMPGIEDMFGVQDGRPVVELRNDPQEPMADIVLPVCYRNPPWVLALAHSLGFGIYSDRLVQHFDDLKTWEDIGYKVESGSLGYGRHVSLSRKVEATPKYFYDLLRPEDVISSQSFDNRWDQYDWVANQIRTNVTEDELDPDDVLVIFPSALSSKKDYQHFAQYLNNYGIQTMLAGVTNSPNMFRIDNLVTCSTIHRVKGNESPMVYLVNADFCCNNFETIKLRNILFTSITRSRAWVRICGVGDRMIALQEEIKKFIDNKYCLTFKIPTKEEMIEIRHINSDKNISKIKQIEQLKNGADKLVDILENTDIDLAYIPNIKKLIKIIEGKGINNYDDKKN